MTRVLVCGGRYFVCYSTLDAVLSRFHSDTAFTALASGCAPGADTLAMRWAKTNRVPFHGYPADWVKRGKAAGPARNAHMLADFRPDTVIAFSGGNGTADMVRRALNAGVQVVTVDDWA